MKKLFFIFPFVFALLFFFCGFAPATKAETVNLPIVMYHGVLKNSRGKYIVTPNQLEDDFVAIKQAGFTPVFLSEVIDWVDGKGNLPKKPIVITFDDGHYNNLHYALPIAKKHDIKFMIYPITWFSKSESNEKDHSNPNYSSITMWQMKEAVSSGLIEIGNHTHNMHKFKPRYGIASSSGESGDDYKKALIADIGLAQDLIELSGVPRPQTFAYPFGKYSNAAKQILVEDLGFRALLTCNEYVSKITKGKPETLYALARFNRDSSMSTRTLMSKIKC